MKAKPVNPKATFNQLKITLPLTPSVKLVKKEVVMEEIKVEEYQINPLLNLIDIDKLKEGRSSFNNQLYSLANLKNLAKKLNILKNEKSKADFIQLIKKELEDAFHGEPNLIGTLKTLTEKDLRHPKKIKILFKKYHIDSDKVIDIIKEYTSATDLLKKIITVLESEWVD